ncbi:hypothetical protein HC761_01925, partial [bacterium]|nr:hypothetical protein [bacterium]
MPHKPQIAFDQVPPKSPSNLAVLPETLQAALAQIELMVLTLHHGAAPIHALYLDLNVGRHVRHVCDHAQALLDGVAAAQINYNFRTRDSETERSSAFALALIASLKTRLGALHACDTPHAIQVLSEMSFADAQSGEFQSTLARELLYLINHTIHHAAYIKLLLSHAG